MPQPRKPPRAGIKTTVKQLDMPADVARKATPRVLELTVGDLNDLATQASGIPVDNGVLKKLTADDLKELVAEFRDLIRTDHEKFGKVIRDAGIAPH